MDEDLWRPPADPLRGLGWGRQRGSVLSPKDFVTKVLEIPTSPSPKNTVDSVLGRTYKPRPTTLNVALAFVSARVVPPESGAWD